VQSFAPSDEQTLVRDLMSEGVLEHVCQLGV
jgi:hypothetical protein